jgi:hypothetical protein
MADCCILSSFVELLAKALVVKMPCSSVFDYEAAVGNSYLTGLLYTTHFSVSVIILTVCSLF